MGCTLYFYKKSTVVFQKVPGPLIQDLSPSEAPVRENGGWKITRPLNEAEISSSIHGLISGRLDRLESSLNTLERLELIRTRTLQPDLEYMFKHPLTQEVVYNGSLKKERQKIHEQIGTVMEQLFHNRLPEFCETLAFHFSRGRSSQKAVHYLMSSAKKSLRR
jgi:predicted ATPase